MVEQVHKIGWFSIDPIQPEEAWVLHVEEEHRKMKLLLA